MCKITQTVGGVNQIRTERHAHALEYLQLPWKPSWRQTARKPRHLLSLFAPTLTPLVLCLYTFHALLCLMHRFYFFLRWSLFSDDALRVLGVTSKKIPTQGEFIVQENFSCRCSSIAAFCKSLLPIPLSLWSAEQCDSTALMQHHANCQKPPGGPTPTPGFSTQSNLAEDTEVRLVYSFFNRADVTHGNESWAALLLEELRNKSCCRFIYDVTVLQSYSS